MASSDEIIGQSLGICAVDASCGNGADSSVWQLCEGRSWLQSRHTYEHDVSK